MRKTILICLTILLFFNLSSVLIADQGNIVILNRTGYDIYYLYISPESSDSWGDDLLGDSEILADGGNIQVTVPGLGKSCIFDLKAVDLDDDSYIKWGLDLCSQGKIVITIEDYSSDEDVAADGAIQDFVLINNTGFTIWNVYISPDYSDHWEEDLLDESEVLYDGEEFSITFSGYEDHCIFDIKIVDSEGDEYIKYGVDLCEFYEVIFSLDDIVY